MISGEFDVVVVGAGNAGMCAALAARGEGARVLVLEAAPFDERGGNSRYTAGALRFVYNGVDDLLKLCDLSETEIATSDFGTYTTDKYYDDLGRLTDYRSNPDMAELLITKSQETLLWMRGQGIRFAPMYSRQAFKHEGKFVFWGGLALEAWGGGPGLVEGLFKAAEERQIQIAYEARGEALIADDDGVHGVDRQGRGQDDAYPGEIGGAGVRRVRGQCRDAHPLSRARLGPRQGARYPLQHRRRHQDGARHRGDALWQLVGLPCGRLGLRRARIRRPRGRRQLPEAQLPVRDHGQRRRCAVLRRGRGLPQLHLCQVRQADPGAAAPVRLADLRPAGRAISARRIPHPPGDEGYRRHVRGTGRQDGRDRCRGR